MLKSYLHYLLKKVSYTFVVSCIGLEGVYANVPVSILSPQRLIVHSLNAIEVSVPHDLQLCRIKDTFTDSKGNSIPCGIVTTGWLVELFEHQVSVLISNDSPHAITMDELTVRLPENWTSIDFFKPLTEPLKLKLTPNLDITLSLLMVYAGYAFLPPSKKAITPLREAYQQAQTYAESHHLGLFGYGFVLTQLPTLKER